MGYVVYEDGGEIRFGTVLTESDSTLQVEAPHGKRSKIKSAGVLLRFAQPEPKVLMQEAEVLQKTIDVDLLWSACPPESEWHFSALAREYQGHEPSVLEQVAVLFRLQAAPIYFHRRQRGHFRVAAPETLKAALAGLERRRLQDQQKAEALEALAAGRCPDWLVHELPALLYRPDKNTLAYKTLETASSALKRSPAQVLAQCGVIGGSRAWHEGRFEFEYFGPWSTDVDFPAMEGQDWPCYEVPAFSIDDAFTTEIDDAFSLREVDTAHWEVGIHIAAPGLQFGPDSSMAEQARARLSTVYMPGRKISMLPERVIARCSLDEGQVRPTLSLLLRVHKETLAVVERRSLIQRVRIGANLRLHELEARWDEEALGGQEIPHLADLRILRALAERLAEARGVRERPTPQYHDYTFIVEGEHVNIQPRPRGAPLDELVAELMIEVNRHWAGQLVEAGWLGLFRVQGQGRTGMSVDPAPHLGLGLNHYAWCSSPLRRYPDLVNQWQLIRLFQQQDPAVTDRVRLREESLSFERAYEAYQDFQRQMERYWSLRWLEQEAVTTCRARLLREGAARIEGLPLVVKVPGAAALDAGTDVQLAIRSIDVWTIELHCELLSMELTVIP